jgi:hypothetical protein
VAIYQCFFFVEDEIRYWVNIEFPADVSLPAVLRRQLLYGRWESAEAWLGETLVCRVQRRSAELSSGFGQTGDKLRER